MSRPEVVACLICFASVAHAAPPVEPSETDVAPPPSSVEETAPPAVPPAVLPPAPPPPPERPRALPVESVGGFDWTALGLVRRDATPPDADRAGVEPARIPKLHDRSDLTLGTVRALGSVVAFRPVSQAAETRIDAFEATFGGGAEFRRNGRLLAPWLDGELGVLSGAKDEAGPDGELTGKEFSMFSMRLSALAGLDLWVAQPVSVGPVAGYRMELLAVSAPGSAVATSNAAAHSLIAGGHLRLSTAHDFEGPPALALDVRVEARTGTFGTATYGNALVGVRLGIVRLLAQIERRFSAPDPGEPSSELATASLEATPFEQRVGAGAALVFF